MGPWFSAWAHSWYYTMQADGIVGGCGSRLTDHLAANKITDHLVFR